MNLIRQQITDALSKWIHRYSSAPKHEVRRDRVRCLFTIGFTLLVFDAIGIDSLDSCIHDYIDIVPIELLLKNSQYMSVVLVSQS